MRANYKARMREREDRAIMADTARLCWKMSLVALNEEFGFGRDRLARLTERYEDIWGEYDKLLDDGRDYADARLDERLRQILGEGAK